MDLDTLFQLKEQRDRVPQWHAFYVPGGSDDDSESMPPLKKKGSKPPLAIKNRASDSDSSMPSLQSVSNSSEDDGSDYYYYGDENGGDDVASEPGDDSGYDTEQEDRLRDMLREAMDIAHEAGFFNTANTATGPDLFSEERKGNPFLKLLGSLRGAFC
jgi:hypothetical protein